MLSIVSSLVGNGVLFQIASSASASSIAFYNVICNIPLWHDLLFMSGVFYIIMGVNPNFILMV